MDGPRDYYTREVNQTRQISYYFTYMFHLKNYINALFTKQKENHMHRQQIYGYQRAKVGKSVLVSLGLIDACSYTLNRLRTYYIAKGTILISYNNL